MVLSREGIVRQRTVVKGTRKAEHFTYGYALDTINFRMIVHHYQWQDLKALVRDWLSACRQHGLGKLIVQTREEDWQRLLRLGFQMEGTISSYRQGRPVYFMSKFFGKKRQTSTAWMEEEEILEQVLLLKQPQKSRPLPPNAEVRVAATDDVRALVALFKQVFDTYPSPLTDPDYLRASMENDLFALVEMNGQVVSAAGAEIDRALGNAEMTNCATLPTHRRYGLMSHLFTTLEDELATQDIRSLFSIARAKSFGMNWVLRQHGYQYRGRLVNNCDICGGFEDMNLWAKEL